MKIPLTHCPACGHIADGLTKFSGKSEWNDPDVLRIAVCVYCAAVNILTADALLRAPTPSELRQALENPILVRTVAAVARLVAEKRTHDARREN